MAKGRGNQDKDVYGNQSGSGQGGWSDPKQGPWGDLQGPANFFGSVFQGASYNPKSGNYSKPAKPSLDTAPAPGVATEDDITKQIREFYERMLGPLDHNDPRVQRLMQISQARSMMSSRNRGLGGSGFSNLNSERAMDDALLGEQGRREGLGVQALGLGSNRDIGLRGLDLQAQQLKYNQGQDRFGQDVLGGQGWGMGIGGLLGAVGGGLLGSLGGPGGIMAGAGIGGGIGSQIGGGIGGMGAGGGSKYSPQQYRPPGGGSTYYGGL